MYLDDLLHIAARANASLDILAARLDSRSAIESPLAEAIRLHLQTAREETRWAARGQSKLHAARIALLKHEMDRRTAEPGASAEDPTTLFQEAADEFRGDVSILDLTAETVAEYEGIQSLRLAGRFQSAMERAGREPDEFSGTGAEVYRGLFELEHTIACLETDSPYAQGNLRESDDYWATHERAQHWTGGRGRHEFAHSLVDIHGGRLDEALTHLTAARELLALPGEDGMRTMEQLSMALAVAECTAATWRVGDSADDLLTACDEALGLFEQIRGRWGVVARSRSPLAAVLRMVLGEIAELVARIPTTDGGRLGLRIALAAKQSGFAELVRAERTLLDDSVSVLLEEVVWLEQEMQHHDSGDPEYEAGLQDLADKRSELEYASSPFLADIVLPQTVEIEPLLDRLRGSIAVDFVQLPLAAADGSEKWYRTTIESPERILFEQLEMGPGCAMLLHDDGSLAHRGLIDRLTIPSAGRSRGWALAADELLPKSVLDLLRQERPDDPVELLISPHMELGRIPWNALVVDGGERPVRLVERAVVAQTPMLSALVDTERASVQGPALVWLAGDVTMGAEQSAWRMASDTLVAKCEVPVDRVDARRGSLAENLAAGSWALAYVACHGDGEGLGQYIEAGDKLTAARALGLPWPHDVVLAACHVGRTADSVDDEPLGFVVAAMVGGARTVVAGLHLVSARGTGEIGRGLIDRLDGRTRLDHALRAAQLAFLGDDEGRSADDLWSWALLTAFVR